MTMTSLPVEAARKAFATESCRRCPPTTIRSGLVALRRYDGGTVGMFSAFYAVLLAPLPYPHASAIVVPVSTNSARGIDRGSIPYGDYQDWREQKDVFAHVAVWRPVPVDVAGGDKPERVEAG